MGLQYVWDASGVRKGKQHCLKTFSLHASYGLGAIIASWQMCCIICELMRFSLQCAYGYLLSVVAYGLDSEFGNSS